MPVIYVAERGRPGPKPQPCVCRVCGEDDQSELVKRKTGRIERLCKTCSRVQSRAYRSENPEYFRGKQRTYRENNPEKYKSSEQERMKALATKRVATAWIGEAVKTWRIANKLTMQQMAEILGVGRYAYTYRERGNRAFKPLELKRLAALNIDIWHTGDRNHAS